MPNRFCAGLCKLLDEETIQDNDFYRIVRSSFEDFFCHVVAHYDGYQDYAFNAVGSIAFVFKDILSEVLQEKGMRMGIILRDPLDGLINYHKNR